MNRRQKLPFRNLLALALLSLLGFGSACSHTRAARSREGGDRDTIRPEPIRLLYGVPRAPYRPDAILRAEPAPSDTRGRDGSADSVRRDDPSVRRRSAVDDASELEKGGTR